jgi:predicted lipoprotein with Yx(FWY)xxD motif
MHRASVVGLTALFSVAAAVGCSGYTDGVGHTDEIRVMTRPTTPIAAPEREPAPEPESPDTEPSPSTPAEVRDTAMPVDSEEMDAGHAEIPDAGSPSNLRLSHTLDPAGYLTDERGQPLYMFVGDVTGSNESACLYTCAHEWPAFDIEVASVSAELEPKAVTRFHRQDGAWQTTYEGHPLYYRAVEAGLHVVSGDGVDGRWFVARDYLAFMSSAHTFTPAGGGPGSAFLTDGFGRTLYVCLDDQPSTSTREAVSSCDGACIVKRPIFPASAADRTSLLPSVIDATELRELLRPDGMLQLSYRGWPLYYFSDDTTPGSTEGHNDRGWRAIDPVSFGRQVEAGANP